MNAGISSMTIWNYDKLNGEEDYYRQKRSGLTTFDRATSREKKAALLRGRRRRNITEGKQREAIGVTGDMTWVPFVLTWRFTALK